MKFRTLLLLVGSVAMTGCSEEEPMVTASGIVFDIAKVQFLRSMGMSGDAALAASVAVGQQISTTLSRDVKSAPSDAMGRWTVKVPANKTFYMIAGESGDFVQTMNTAKAVTTTDQDLEVPPVIACPRIGPTSLLAAGAGISSDELMSRGFVMVETAKAPPPPNQVGVSTMVSIDEAADYDIYQMNIDSMGVPSFAKGNHSPVGVHGIVAKSAAAKPGDVHVHATDPTGGTNFPTGVFAHESGFFSTSLILAN